jgi:hypothetical protein
VTAQFVRSPRPPAHPSSVPRPPLARPSRRAPSAIAPEETTATCCPARVRSAMSAAIPTSQSRRTAPDGSTSSARADLDDEAGAGGRCEQHPPPIACGRRHANAITSARSAESIAERDAARRLAARSQLARHRRDRRVADKPVVPAVHRNAPALAEHPVIARGDPDRLDAAAGIIGREPPMSPPRRGSRRNRRGYIWRRPASRADRSRKASRRLRARYSRR